MTPLEKLKSKPPEKLVEIDGVEFLVRGSTRSETALLVADMRNATEKGGTAMAAVENGILAKCVLDPSTGEPVLPDADEWYEVAKVTSEKLVDAFMSLDHNEVKGDATVKK